MVLPWSWLTIFKQIDIAWKIKLLKLPEYLKSWNTSKTEVLHFGPKIMGHLLPRYSIGYKWLQNSVMNHNWSNIWTKHGPFFLDQNVTPPFLRCSSFLNILVILNSLLLTLCQLFWKALVMTVATLIQWLKK